MKTLSPFQQAYKVRYFLTIVVIVAALLRGAVFFSYLQHDNRYWQVDSRTYNRIATQLATNNGYREQDGTPHVYRLPGYPTFLATFYKIFGTSHIPPLIAQILLSALLPLIIFILAITLFPHALAAAQLACAYSAIHLGLVLYAGFLMTETLFMLFFLLFLACFFSTNHLFFCPTPSQPITEKDDPIHPGEHDIPMLWYEDDVVGYSFINQHDLHPPTAHDLARQKVAQGLFVAGILLGFASLIRPVGHVCLALALLLIACCALSWKEKLQRSLLLSIGWIIPVGPWLVRNFILFGALFFHTLPGGHFLYLSAARVHMFAYQTSYQEARSILKEQVEARIAAQEKLLQRPLNEYERCTEHEKLTREIWLEHPFITIKVWCTDMLRTKFSLYSAELRYLENNRQDIEYFQRERSISSWFTRYLWPENVPTWLHTIIILEILFFMLMLCGVNGFFMHLAYQSFNKKQLITTAHNACAGIQALAFFALFVVLALAGGYARMRLPVEPLLFIISCQFWTTLCTRKTSTTH